jgi:hypothetical protein
MFIYQKAQPEWDLHMRSLLGELFIVRHFCIVIFRNITFPPVRVFDQTPCLPQSVTWNRSQGLNEPFMFPIEIHFPSADDAK